MASLAPATASAAPSEGPPEELQDFIYDLEKGTKGWTGPGGSAKEATVAEFPLSQSIAGVSMRLDVSTSTDIHIINNVPTGTEIPRAFLDRGWAGVSI